MPKPKNVIAASLHDTVMVYTGNSIRSMVAQGGCGHWKADAKRVRRMKYLAACCMDEPGSEPGAGHGDLFMVATIDSVEASKDERWLITLKQFARITNRPASWPEGYQNPVTYTSLHVLDIDPEELRWIEWPKPQDLEPDGIDVRPLTFEQAKVGLAMAMGVRPEQVEITIRA
jgi:hypothetical protein